MKTKLQSLGFNASHAYLLTVAVALFVALTFVQSDLNLRTLFANADSETEMLTYESVRDELVADQSPIVSDEVAMAEAEKQLALLDRSLENGQVLGESIGLGAVPQADQIFSREQLDSIVVTTEKTNPQSIQRYAERVLRVESENNALEVMANLNSSDSVLLTNTKQQITVIIQDLKGLAVPEELADYHRYKMIYYQTLASMADSFASNNLNTDFQNTSKILFSIMEKIEQTKNVIQTQYSISI